jgi:hypothetical protein
MQTRAVFAAAFLLMSNAAAIAEDGLSCQSTSRLQASSFDVSILPVTLRSEAPFAQAFLLGPCRTKAPVCTGATNYSVRQQWALSQ